MATTVSDPRHAVARASAALLVAGGVTLLAAGFLAWTGPPNLGSGGATGGSPGASASASPSATGAGPSGAGPSGTATAGASGSPSGSPVATAGGSGSPSGSPAPTGLGQAAPTRVVVPALGIDLGVYRDDYPGGVTYPLCDAAQYFIPEGSDPADKLGLPGQPGRTTYIYGHARTGMFLPLLTQSQADDGAGMLGDVVQIYTADDHLYLYEIFRVKRHTRDFSLAASVPATAQWLILQTSEGPNYTYPKLQVAASLLTVQPADASASKPSTTPAPSCPK